MKAVNIEYHEYFVLEAYAALMNARPVAVIVTRDRDKPFKVGRLDSLRFIAESEHRSRIAAVRRFAEMCCDWCDG